MHLNTLKDIDVQIHMHPFMTSSQLSMSDICQCVDDVKIPCRMMKTLTWALVRVWLLVLSQISYTGPLDIPNDFSRAPLGLVSPRPTVSF